MFEDKVFIVILGISVIIHGVILIQQPGLDLPSLSSKQQKVEINYLKPKQEELKQGTTDLKKEGFLKLNSQVIMHKTPPPFINQSTGLGNYKERAVRDTAFVKPAFTKPDVIAIKKKITLPPVELEKIDNPSYISYYQLVREKIKRAAYQNYTSSEVGEVYLSFIVSNDGYLREVRLAEEKSSSNSYLKEIAMQSIKSASPFPNFPKELDYPQLSFNVIISFEIE